MFSAPVNLLENPEKAIFMRVSFPFIALLLLTGSTPANTGLYDKHPILRLFSPEQKEETKDTAKVLMKEQSGIHLQIWTGTGTIAQQNLFTFSDKTIIDRNRENLNWWFRLKTDDHAEFFLWQVAGRPFAEPQHDWKEPEGLVASGPVVIQFGLGNDSLFEIEFDEFINRQTSETSNKKTTYYIRVVALDAMGEPAGNPSNTVMAHYISRN